MTAYYLVYAWILIASLLLYIGKLEYGKAKKLFCILSFSAVFLLFALKHPFCGGDYRYGQSNGYLALFCKIAGFSWQEALTEEVYNFERGYILFNKFLSLISDDHQFFLAACAAVCFLPIGYTVYKLSDHPDLSVYVFLGMPVFSLFFSAVRQVIAISFCVLALLWVMEKKPVRFILTVLLAMSFHTSAAVFLVAYPAYHLKLNKPLRWLSCAVPPLVFVFRYPLFSLASKLYAGYTVPDYNNSYRLFVIFYLIYIFCCLFSDERKELSGLKNLFLGACCVQAMSGVHSIIARVGYYFVMPLMILLPLVISSMKHKKLAVFFKVAISLCFIVYGLYSLRTGTWSRSYPYYAFWQW